MTAPKQPAPHDSLELRDHETHVYSVPAAIVRRCADGRVLYRYARRWNKVRRQEVRIA